jgi:hypothetical protein
LIVYIQKVPLAWEDRACLGSCPHQTEGTYPVQNTACRPKLTVSADGKGIVSQAGVLLLAETLRVTGLGQSLADGLAR